MMARNESGPKVTLTVTMIEKKLQLWQKNAFLLDRDGALSPRGRKREPRAEGDREMALTLKQTDVLTAALRGSEYRRSSDKDAAFTKLLRAVMDRLGEEGAKEIAMQMIEAKSVEEAEAILARNSDEVDAPATAEEPAVETEETEAAEAPAPAAPEVETSAEEPSVAATQAASPEEVRSSRGRSSSFAGKKLFPVAGAKPRRPGTHGERSLGIIQAQPGISYEDFIAAGGRRVDLAWDVDHGKAYVE